MTLVLEGDSTELCMRDECCPVGGFDQDGLPIWQRCEHGSWRHVDPDATMMALVGATKGISIPDCDRWLSNLRQSPIKISLLKVRAAALEAARENRWDDVWMHMERIGVDRYHMLREAFLAPLARTGQSAERGRKRGGEESRKTRRGDGSKRQAIIKLLAKYQGPPAARVTTVAKASGATERYVRKVMREQNPEP